jgi:hypothetical protein
MKFTWLVCALLCLQEEIPFKPTEEFEIKLNFEFKEREGTNVNKIEMDQTEKEYKRSRSSGPLPYLNMSLRAIKLTPDEVRVRIQQNGKNVALNKKIDTTTILKLDLGFTDDIKDRVSPHEYTVFFLNQDKQPLSKVIIFFEEDGTYLVNGQKRGKL